MRLDKQEKSLLAHLVKQREEPIEIVTRLSRSSERVGYECIFDDSWEVWVLHRDNASIREFFACRSRPEEATGHAECPETVVHDRTLYPTNSV